MSAQVWRRGEAVNRGRHRARGGALAVRGRLASRLSGDHLLTNSLYLMLNTVAMAVLGLVFWLIAAQIYSPGQIGAGTTLISASGLLGLAGMLGFNNSLVRYLPTSLRRNAHINTGLLLVLGGSVLLAVGYVLIIPWIAPRLAFVHDSPLMFAGFVLFTAGSALNQLTDSIFVAYRAARYNLLLDGGLQSGAKIALILLMQGLGAYGVFASAGLAATIAVVASVLILVRRFGYRPAATVDRQALGQVAHFAGGNYIVSLLNLSPVLLLPIIVVDRLGTASAGYFYIAFMIANVVFAAAYAVSQSLFAEAAYEERPTGELVRRGARIMLALIVPAGAVLAFGSRLIMMPFGSNYQVHASTTLAVLGFSAPVVAAADMCGAIMRARNLIVRYVLLNAAFAASVIGLSLLWATSSLVGIALAWLVGNAVAVAFGILLLLPRRRAPHRGRSRWSVRRVVRSAWCGVLVRRGWDATSSLVAGQSLVLAPHADDETLGCGSLIARASAEGHRVHVAIATDGSMSSPRSALLPPAELRRTRVAEMRAAGTVLGLPTGALTGLGFPDGRLGDNTPALVRAISSLLTSVRPDRVFINTRNDPHPDHQALNAALMTAMERTGWQCDVYEYPVWQWVRGPLAWQSGIGRTIRSAARSALLLGRRPALVKTAGFLDTKRRSLGEYKSQMTNLTGEPEWQWLDEAFVEHFLTENEIFFQRVQSRDPIRAWADPAPTHR